MEAGSKVKSSFLSGIALCIVSGLLLLLGTVGLLSQNADVGARYFFVPMFFLVIGIIAVATSRKKPLKSYVKPIMRKQELIEEEKQYS